MLTGRKLLLADDSLTIQKVVSLTFGDEAMQVTTAGGGAEALEKLGESLPDIVLADVFMPEPNGYALCERIKTDERTRHIPVVLLVGTFEPFNEAEARRVGADDVLTKPFQSIRDLVNKVGGLLGGQHEEKNTDAEGARDEHHDAEEATRDLSPFAADARAADPSAETPATPTPASAFDDFDMDDATIQTTPAAAFDALHNAPGFPRTNIEEQPDVEEEINVEEQFSDRGETEEAFVLSDDDAPAPEVRANAASAASSSAAGSPVASPVAESAFDAHASRAAEADDALLELGDIAPARTATAEADDFILDMGDDDDPFDLPAFKPSDDTTAEADMLFAEHAQTTEVPEAFAMPGMSTETELFSESQFSEEPEMSASSGDNALLDFEPATALPAEEPMDLEAPEILESPSLLFGNEPSADAHLPESSTDREGLDLPEHTPAWDRDPVAASIVAHAGGVAIADASGASRSAETFGDDAGSSAVAAGSGAPAAAAAAAVSESSQGTTTTASSLSPEMLEEVVRRVVAQMSEKVVREIAWEVVPEMAERLIKRRLEEEQSRTR